MPYESVFITGASSGLGRGLALHYARLGATVHAAARRKEMLDTLQAEAGEGRIVPVELDVQDRKALVAAVRAAEAAHGGALDLVVANAGIGRPTPGTKIDVEWVARLLDVNATSACATIAAALPAMVARKRGHVVGVSSLAAYRGLPGNAAYCASKAALSVFLESLRVDLRGTGVAVTAIYPGFVKTELTAKNKFPMPFLMELDDAVRAMARGIEARRAAVTFPAPMAAMASGMSALPRFLYDALAKMGGSRVDR
jgi:NADP-dependent 3-hydroxy acid dehydrogenase YdfG